MSAFGRSPWRRWIGGVLLALVAVVAGMGATAEAARKRPNAKVEVSATASAAKSPTRAAFDAADQSVAAIDGISDARFWGDSVEAFARALPAEPGPWLILSGGGADGAFGAGLLVGWSERDRPRFSVVTGVSVGALIAPYAFLGAQYDDRLREVFTTLTAGDIYEHGATGESLLDTWPLRRLIARHVTPELLAAVAAAHESGRRLLVVTMNLDAERPVVWNMGAIAASGHDFALELFRDVLYASAAIPGIFPPGMISVEAGERSIVEMHGDGSLSGPFYVAPEPILVGAGRRRLPATSLYTIVNTKLGPEFSMVERDTLSILARGIAIALKATARGEIALARMLAERNGLDWNLAFVPSNFNGQARGPFDPDYMAKLFEAGAAQGRSASPFQQGPVQPDKAGRVAVSPSDRTTGSGHSETPDPDPAGMEQNETR